MIAANSGLACGPADRLGWRAVSSAPRGYLEPKEPMASAAPIDFGVAS